jgi:hypothetical protein
MPLRTYLATKPGKAVRFLLRCELTNYYNYNYRLSSETHYSVRLYDPESSESAHGYVRKSSVDGERMFALLRDGREHTLAVELQTVGPNGEELEINGDGHLAIVKFIDGH